MTRPKKRRRFNPANVGVIVGLRLAAWTVEKTPVMVETYRERNGIQPPAPTKDGRSKIDPRDPVSGYACARIIMNSLGMELALKQIAQLSHGDGRGPLDSHDLLHLWDDLPEETRGLLEERFRKEVGVYSVPRDGSGALKPEELPTIREVCECNRHAFIKARYVAEAQGKEGSVADDGLKAALMILTDLILGKMGHAPASMPADDATLHVRYEPNPEPVPE